MKLKDLTQFPTDYLDAYCEAELGHTNWAFVDKEEDISGKVHARVVFFNEPKEEHE